MSFAHLHVHSEYSLLDGACRIEPMLDKVKSMGQTSVAITDHGVMYGALQFYSAAKARGLNPIIGCEVYVAVRTRFDKVNGIDNERYHLTLLCKDYNGYKNLCKIVSSGWTEGFYTKPRVDREIIEKYHEGLIALSGCFFGEISRKIISDDYEEAKNTALWYKNVFGDGNYYIEIQNHGIEDQLRVNADLLKLSEETGIPLAATNDVHYIDKEDSKVQKVLICIQTNKLLTENTGFDFSSDEFYLKTEEEMLEAFDFCPQAVYNTSLIADKCHIEFEFGHTKLPHYDVPAGFSHFDWFKKICNDGLIKRYGNNPPEDCVERMNYELNVIDSMGYTDYYLIVRDFIAYAKQNDIPVGPGRGSGAASICAYCIGITDIDPMKHNLLFERFLNPERVSMPDFDVDFCFERRGEVIEYVIRKYGSDRVAQIVTFGTLAAKAAIRDVGRVMGISYSKVDSIAKLIPNELNITIDSALEKSKELRDVYNTDPEANELIVLSKKVEGMPRHASTHAAGVVITAEPVVDYVPLAVNDNCVVTQFTMKDLEKLGLLKMDFLGLRTLTVIKYAENLIKRKNPGFSIENIDYNDAGVYRMFSNADTAGVFQFESAGMRRVLLQFKPQNIEDIIAIISLYRPGPMESIPTYIHNKNNPSAIKYSSEKLKDILDVTCGCMVYQEQVMQICREIAGYSYGRADIVRRAMAKKQHAVMLQERGNFVNGITDEKGNIICDGAVRRGMSETDANKLFDEMVSFASYAFNKAHAAAYAYVAYRTAYLKYYYPKEFFASLLTSFIDRSDKISEYIYECRKLGIKIIPPNINFSESSFVSNDEGIVFTLNAVKNVGRNLINQVVNDRNSNGNYSDLYDFCKRIRGRELNKRAVESLIKSGAFDGMGANRKQMTQSLELIFEELENSRRSNVEGQISFGELGSNKTEKQINEKFVFPYADEFPENVKLSMEKEVCGLYISGHPAGNYSSVIKSLKTDIITDIINDDQKYNDGKKVNIIALITSVKKKITKNNSTLVFITAEDISGAIEILVFNKVYEQYRSLINEGSIVFIHGHISADDESNTVICESLEPVPSVSSEQQKKETKKVKGLFLRFDTAASPQIPICMNLLSIFDDGTENAYIYYSDRKKYERLNDVSVNNTLLKELTKILGSDNVIYNK